MNHGPRDASERVETSSESQRAPAAGRLEALKHVVEIVAIVVAGGWAFTEFVIVRTLQRLEMSDYAWVTPSLVVNAGKQDDGQVLLHISMTLRNGSKRAVHPLLTTFSIELPRPGTAENEFLFRNSNRIDELKPTEEGQEFATVLVRSPPPFVMVRAKTYLRHELEGHEECIVDPGHPIEDVAAYEDAPVVCTRDMNADAKVCQPAPNGCRLHRAEKLVSMLEPEKKAEEP